MPIIVTHGAPFFVRLILILKTGIHINPNPFSGHLRQLSLDRLRSLSSPSGANCLNAVSANDVAAADAEENEGDEVVTCGGDGGSPALAMAMGAVARRAGTAAKAGCKS